MTFFAIFRRTEISNLCSCCAVLYQRVKTVVDRFNMSSDVSEVMHLSKVCPRIGGKGRASNPLELDFVKRT